MSKDWQRIEELFHQASTLSPTERAGFLATACTGYDAVREEVEALLSAEDSGGQLPDPFIPAGLMPGQRIGRYEIVSTCGRGAGGTVYLGLDPDNGRKVAIKVFPALLSAEQRRRYLKEVRAVSVLRHPYIVAVEDSGNSGDRDYLVMEYVEGRTIGEVIPAGGMPVEDSLELARMIVEGLAAAHQAGIVHRDLKPSNVMRASSGSVKILDFGLAKLTQREGDEMLADSMGTASGQILGTACYLSPEQARGEQVDARTDVFSFGALLYEMLTGVRPFDRGSLAGTLAAILRDSPPPVRELRGEIPKDISRLVERCLEKDRGKRFASAEELLKQLMRCQAALNGRWRRISRTLKRREVAVPIAAAAIIIAAAASVLGYRSARVNWARTEIEPQIVKLVEQHRYNAADELVSQIEKIVPGDQIVRDFARDYRLVTSILTTPEGAEIAIKDYAAPERPWRVIGHAPLKKQTVPHGYHRWRVSAPGYRTREFAETGTLQPEIRFTLYPDDPRTADMEVIPAGLTYGSRAVKVGQFYLDRFEVTNRKFQEFVDAGGYQRKELWRAPIVIGSKTVRWEQAMAAFRDTTGRAGPAGWELGHFPEGKGDFPVTGVSWYEADAFARFVGKRLPVYNEWLRAARTEWLYADAVMISNFSGKGLAPVGSFHGLDRFGSYDLAGNCKEWLWNEWGGHRLTMGGSWDEAYYAAGLRDSAPPWERRANIGFRCAKAETPPAPAFFDPVQVRLVRDYAKEKPVSDEEFAEIRKVYDYAQGPLQEKLEATDESNLYWRMEKVSYEATYPGERITAYLFLPRDAQLPYQTVVYFASGQAYNELSSSHLEMWFVEPLIRSGRAVLYPVLWGMYERKPKQKMSGAERRRLQVTRNVVDLRRSLDYLGIRQEVAQDKLALFGFSSGAAFAPIVTAVEPRFKVVELAGGGLVQSAGPPETDPFQFLSRSQVPVLLMNGRYDSVFPEDQSQQTLFKLLGAPAKDKKLVLIDSGHAMVGYPAVTRESLDWLDRYLGAVPMPAHRR